MTERLRRLGWIGWTLVALCLLIAAGGSFVGIQYARAVSLGPMSPTPGSLLRATSVDLSCNLPGFEPGRGAVLMNVDGRPLPAESLTLSPGALRATAAVSDGHHVANVVYSSANIFSRKLSLSWSFTTDTTPPQINISSSTAETIKSPNVPIRAGFDTQATAELRVDGAPVTVQNQGTSATADITVAEGQHTFLLRAMDVAGNVAEKSWQTFVEFNPPKIDTGTWQATWTKSSSRTLTFTVSDSFIDNVAVSATLDGASVQPVRSGTAGNTWSFAMKTGDLAEGTHTVQIDAVNKVGSRTSAKSTFLVHTSDKFGARPLGLGAVGAAVKTLQEMLKNKRFYTGAISGTLNEATAKAVAAYKQKHGLAGQTLVDSKMYPVLLGHILVSKSKCTLTLYEDGKVTKTYLVAVGVPAWPTPSGDFTIVDKQVDPTWYPPVSSWAAGASPIGPGPNCPLQARWMGLDTYGVGIHGTNAPSTVGSQASHGCMRMTVPDVKDLYDRVYLGTTVKIVP